jgi:hypothetical protein
MRKRHQCLKFISSPLFLGGTVCLGGLQNGYRKIQALASPHKNPQHNNTQQQDEPPPPYPPAVLPSISMATAATAPAVGSAAPYGSRSGARRLVIAHRAGWFPFGTPK